MTRSPPSLLTLFRDLHRGERCVVVCNGPSLNRMDLRALRGEVVFGLNKIHLGLKNFGFYPRYLVAVNPKVIAQTAEAWRQMTAIKFISETPLVPQDAFTFHIRTEGLSDRFYRDITQGVRGGHTVTHAAFQIAYYMGFSQIIVIGMDHRFAYDGAPNSELHMVGPDPNHFSPDYFRDQDWDAPNLDGSETSYRVAREIFEADGRQILDATLDGACTVFDKVAVEEILPGALRPES